MAAQTPPSAPEPPKKGGLPMKTLAVMSIALVIEAVAISGAFMFAGKPAEVKADKLAQDEAAKGEEPVEKQIIEEKFQNNRSGKTYLYDTDIWIVIRAKDEAKVDEMLERMQAQIAADIAMIFRRAEPSQLLEPTLATLQRQIKAVLDERMGTNPDGKSMVQQVLMKKYTQYRADAF
jgi:flagellar basal body-associated protein FliL